MEAHVLTERLVEDESYCEKDGEFNIPDQSGRKFSVKSCHWTAISVKTTMHVLHSVYDEAHNSFHYKISTCRTSN